MKQRGFSAIEVILVIAVVALLGAVGWLLWNQLNKAEVKQTQQSTSEQVTVEKPEEKVSMVDAQLTSTDGFPVSFKVPADWTIKQSPTTQLTNDEKATITSPDKTFVITMNIARIGRGFGPDSPTATILDVQKSSGTDLKWLVVDHYVGGTSSIGLQIPNSTIIPEVGSQKVIGSSVYKIGETSDFSTSLEMYAGFPASTPSLEEFNANENATQAKAIFESIKL